jgi:peptide/nickel transport system substrate-binding protein
MGKARRRTRTIRVAAAVALTSLIGVFGVVAAGPPTASAATGGGSLNVLENASFEGSWAGLDPATNTNDAADENMMDAIYGGLFEQGNDNKIIPDLAAGYAFSDGGLTFTISLRPNVKFTDGTPFDAQAVVYNIERDLQPQYGCLCDSSFPVSSIVASGPLTVVMHLKQVFAPIVSAFLGSAPNWIISPTALSKMGEKAFAITPVGAGPFQVVSDKLSSVLELKANPTYWQKGLPYLSTLTFTAVGSDESAYEAIQAGQGQAYQDFSTVALVAQAKQKMTVTTIPAALGPYVVQLNTGAAPFNNIVAREALYYATDPGPINKAIEGGLGTISQSPSGPGDLFYFPTVPGYRTYNLAKATALVKQLGGLSIGLITSSAGVGVQLATALKSQWAAAGIDATIDADQLPALVSAFHSGGFQAALQTAGGYDTAIGNGMSLRYASDAPFTGVKDPQLDKLINAGVATLNTASRRAIYQQIAKYLSDNAYSPFLFNVPSFNLSAKGVSGPGLTTSNFFVLWEDVRASS